MDFVEIINILDSETSLNRNCRMFKSADLMQKTVNYIGTSTFSININEDSFNNINQLFFINDNDSLYVYLEQLLDNNNKNYKIYSLNEISEFEVLT